MILTGNKEAVGVNLIKIIFDLFSSCMVIITIINYNNTTNSVPIFHLVEYISIGTVIN